jgi:pimeloyl-ACP methyl ester carboxylesterase
MSEFQPFVREAGAGGAVVCIHANASSSSQWRSLMELLASTCRVLAPDCYGSGRSSDWHSGRLFSLHDEVEFLKPVFEGAGPSFDLVGHSYGAAVALIAALKHLERVRSLILYEPTLFSIIEADSPAPNDADGIRHAVAASVNALDEGDDVAAAGFFIDYWMGQGAWSATPADRRASIVASIKNVRRWAHALFTEPTPVTAFAELRIPVLLLTGGRSTVSAQGVARRLLPNLAFATQHEFPKLGHMGPVTHPHEVNPVIARFLNEV